MICEEESLL